MKELQFQALEVAECALQILDPHVNYESPRAIDVRRITIDSLGSGHNGYCLLEYGVR
jgi:hypothetical protein